MGMAQRMKPLIARLDAVADPAFMLFRARGRTGIQHIRKGGVARHREPPAPQSASERLREMKPIERQDRAQAGLDPEDIGIVTPVGHGKHAAAIGQHQQFGINHGRGDGSVHTGERSRVF
ncbi:hypothetical protein NS277_00695 [Novosphingobium barchaimii]|nr:hypothetical protein NS277_00695 [Novosphingobium barchaimii]